MLTTFTKITTLSRPLAVACLASLLVLPACSSESGGSDSGSSESNGATTQTSSRDGEAKTVATSLAKAGDEAAAAVPRTADEVADAVGDAAREAESTVSNVAETATEAVDETAEAARQGTSKAKARMADAATAMAADVDTAREQLSKSRRDLVSASGDGEVITGDFVGDVRSAAARKRAGAEAGTADATPTKKPAPATPSSTAGATGAGIVKPEPAEIDLGRIPTGKQVAGTVKLVNTGDTPVTLSECKTSCGCTTTACPKGEVMHPGDEVEIEVKMRGSSVGGQSMKKTVTFMVSGQPPIRVPVTGETFAYTEIEPGRLDPDVDEGRVTLRTVESDEPFRVIRMHPEIVADFSEEPALEHEVVIDYAKWREMGSPRKVVFYLDHPQSDRLYLDVFSQADEERRLEEARVAREEKLQQIREARERLAKQQGEQPATDPATTPAAENAPETRETTPPPPPLNVDRAIFTWIKSGLDDRVIEAVRTGDIDPNFRNPRGDIPLLSAAAEKGRVRVVQTLIDHDADIEARDKVGRTPLMHAALSKSAETIRLLLDAGADVNTRDQILASALIWAAGIGDAESVRELVDAGAELDARDLNGWSPLIWAAGIGDAERVKALIELGADIEERDFLHDAPPLLHACQKGPPENVQVLIDAGADLTVVDKEGRNAMEIAASRVDDRGAKIVAILEPLMPDAADEE